MILKIVISAGMVLAITTIAEKVSTRFAGVLLGFPLGAGLSILFFGMEQGAHFAAESALWGIPGILASLCAALAYAVNLRYSRLQGRINILFSMLVAGCGFFVAAKLLHLMLPAGSVFRILITLIGIVVFAIYFRSFPTYKILLKVPLTASVLAARAGFTAAIILSVTSVAHSIGPQWAGLFSSFPVTLLPAAVILHYHYGTEAVFALFRELPLGIVAIVIFDLVVAASFPILGVGFGLLLSYAAAFLYLLAYELYLRKYLTERFFS